MGHTFHCNICGAQQFYGGERFEREGSSCDACGSSMRARAVIHSLSMTLWQNSVPLPEFPVRPDVCGIGLSDWDGYAVRLADKLAYSNTYYHQPPRLDICNPPGSMNSSLDFLISSDVFEHVLPPVSRAFDGAFFLLNPGGWLILTVPYMKDGQTIEKYPGLHEYRTLKVGDRWALINLRKDGIFELHPDPIFHGGPGATVEVRMMGQRDLLQQLQAAGFEEIRIVDDNLPAYGILWDIPDHLPIIARKPGKNGANSRDGMDPRGESDVQTAAGK